MRRILILILAASVAAAAPLGAQTTPKSMFARVQAREQTARKALDAGRPAEVVRKDVTRVVAGYESLVGRFPRSGYSDNALWQAAMLAASSFARYHVEGDRTEALRLLKRLGTEYPSSSLMRQARPAMARLSGIAEPPATRRAATPAGNPEHAVALGPAPAAAPVKEPPPPAPMAAPMPVPTPAHAIASSEHAPGALAQLRAVRRTVLPEVVRVAIELDREVDFHNDRITGPDRVFVDLQDTEVSSAVQPSATFDDGIVKAVRIGPRPGGATRVVLDLSSVGHYSVFTLYNPFRVVVDLDREGQPGVPAVLKASGSTASDNVMRAALDSAVHPPPDTVATAPSAPVLVPEKVVVPAEEPVKPAPQVDSVAPGATLLPAPSPSTEDATPAPTIPARPAPAGVPTANAPANVIPKPPAQNLQGRFSLSRQLGLGISRIVIDPGHGGHDPGAQSRGLNEADLVLDVALRLQQLLARTPGVEVVLTRSTNVFVPLEERTAIANRENADLFLSIHANASRNPKARGIETYFLNFASNPDAEAVAARENSASGQTMHDLPDIVKAITLNNKLDESRDFATLVQRSMIGHLGTSNKGIRDLGVRQAPFVVLIGAGMPSILAEISFLTHTQEGHLLKTTAYRQRIAEALYQGLQEYQRSLKAVKSAAASN